MWTSGNSTKNNMGREGERDEKGNKREMLLVAQQKQKRKNATRRALVLVGWKHESFEHPTEKVTKRPDGTTQTTKRTTGGKK